MYNPIAQRMMRAFTNLLYHIWRLPYYNTKTHRFVRLRSGREKIGSHLIMSVILLGYVIISFWEFLMILPRRDVKLTIKIVVLCMQLWAPFFAFWAQDLPLSWIGYLSIQDVLMKLAKNLRVGLVSLVSHLQTFVAVEIGLIFYFMYQGYT